MKILKLWDWVKSTAKDLFQSPLERPEVKQGRRCLNKQLAKAARNYRKEYDQYQGTPLQKKRRADRNRARRIATKEGRVHKGDGKELDHVGFHRRGRLRHVPTKVVSRHANRIRQPPRH